jgi:excisionase family DNA binding protein
MAARNARLEAGDMLSTDEAAEYVGVTRVTVNAWISKGRAIGLAHIKRGFKLPKWQFEPAMWRALPALSQALQTTEGWALLSFLETPTGALRGATPRAAIEQGMSDRVLKLAAAGDH